MSIIATVVSYNYNIPLQPFAQRLLTPLLVEIDTEKESHGQAEEVTFEVFTPGVCHQTFFGI